MCCTARHMCHACCAAAAPVLQALGEHEEAEQLLSRAAGVCCEVKLQDAELPAGTARKLQLLLDVLHADSSAGACGDEQQL